MMVLGLLSILGRAESAQEMVFQVEPVNGFTVVHTGELPANSEVFLEVSELPRNQRLLVSRCGKPCDTAKDVFALVGRGEELVNRSFAIEEAGTS
jgi:hypothetical protein